METRRIKCVCVGGGGGTDVTVCEGKTDVWETSVTHKPLSTTIRDTIVLAALRVGESSRGLGAPLPTEPTEAVSLNRNREPPRRGGDRTPWPAPALLATGAVVQQNTHDGG